MRGDRRVLGLLAFHLVGGPLTCWLATLGFDPPPGYPRPISVMLLLITFMPHVSLAFCQACLLGVWAAFSGARWWLRMAGLVAGIVAIEFLLTIAVGTSLLRYDPPISAAAMTAVLLLVRWRGVRLLRLPDSSARSGPEGIEPSIRRATSFLVLSIQELLVFTIVIALFLVVARALATIHPAWAVLLVVAWNFCCVGLGVAAVWATLGRGRTAARSVMVLIVSIGLGAVLAYLNYSGEDLWANLTNFTKSWELLADYAPGFMMTSGMLSAFLLGSLLVVRAGGYRLVGPSEPFPDVSPKAADFGQAPSWPKSLRPPGPTSSSM